MTIWKWLSHTKEVRFYDHMLTVFLAVSVGLFMGQFFGPECGLAAQQAPSVAAAPAVAPAAPAPAPVRVTPPVKWLQDYAIYLSNSSDLQKLQAQLQLLAGKLQAEMDKSTKECPNGCALNAVTADWTPKPKPAAKE